MDRKGNLLHASMRNDGRQSHSTRRIRGLCIWMAVEFVVEKEYIYVNKTVTDHMVGLWYISEESRSASYSGPSVYLDKMSPATLWSCCIAMMDDK